VTPIAHSDIQAELDRILVSKGFAGAERQRRLLRYIVEHTLAGTTDELKEYAVGIEVFDRDDNYDPRLDSIVRVEAGRLRSRLDEYYNGEGAAAPLRITLPRGGYVAEFEARQPPAAPVVPLAPPTGRAWASWPLTAGLVIAVAAMVVWLGGWNRTPAQTDNADVAVLPFTSEPGNESLAARMTEGVTAELARLGTVSVVSHTSALQFADARRSMREVAGTLNADFVVEASLEREAGGVLLVTRLVNAQTDRKVWVADYRGAADDVRGISQRMAFEISAEVARRRQAPSS
jgi:TolB-like protein